MNQRVYTKDAASLTRFVTTMLWILAGITVVSVGSDVLQLQLLNSGSLDVAAAEANDARQSAIGIVYLIAYLVTAVAFLTWIHRANRNARGFGAEHLRFTPGWAVGWYFVPFMNLVRPYQAMKEIWQASRNPEDWSTQAIPPILGWWWALFLISGFLAQITLRLSVRADTVEALRTSTMVSITAGLVDIPLCIVALTLITNIFQMQTEFLRWSISQ